jgi:inner membrane transporter RhtA
MMPAAEACASIRNETAARNARLGALGSLLCGMLCVQLGAALAKLLFPVLGATGTASLRVLLACAILIPVICVQRRRVFAWPGRKAAGAILAYGLCLGVMNTVFYAALARLPLGITVAIEFMGPLSLALLASRRAIDLLWIVLAVGGLLLLLQPWQALHRLDPLGVLLALGAGMAWALYILTGRRVGRHVEGIDATALGMAIASIVVLPFAAQAVPQVVSRPDLLLAALGMALLSSAVPYSIEMMAMRRMSMRGFSVLMSLEPAIAALTGLALLDEHLSPLRWLAIGGIVAASLGSSLTDPLPE